VSSLLRKLQVNDRRALAAAAATVRPAGSAPPPEVKKTKTGARARTSPFHPRCSGEVPTRTVIGTLE
jgi:hypothetical protein